MNRVFVHVDRVVLRGVEAERRDDTLAQLREVIERKFTDREVLSRLETSVPALSLSRTDRREGKGMK